MELIDYLEFRIRALEALVNQAHGSSVCVWHSDDGINDRVKCLSPGCTWTTPWPDPSGWSERELIEEHALHVIRCTT